MFIKSVLSAGLKLYGGGFGEDAKECFKLVPLLAKMQGEKQSYRPFTSCAHFNFGFILKKEEDLYAAIDALSSAILIDQAFYGAIFMKAMCLFELGYVDESLAVSANSPPSPPFQIETFSAKEYLLGEEGGVRMDPVTLESVRRRLMHANYSGTLPRDEITRRHEQWGGDVRAQLGPPAQHSRAGLDPEKRLRIGYISGDLRRHVVCFNIVPLLPHRDRARTHTTLYYCGGLKEDEVPPCVTGRARDRESERARERESERERKRE